MRFLNLEGMEPAEKSRSNTERVLWVETKSVLEWPDFSLIQRRNGTPSTSQNNDINVVKLQPS